VARVEMRNQREQAKGMNEATEEFIIDSDVAFSAGVCGRLKRVLVDPVARLITYLVIAPGHRRGTGHLVPIDLVTSTEQKIQLRCSRSEYDSLATAAETRVLASGDVDVRLGDHVHATDGPIGCVQGLAVDPRDHHMTHILFDGGHLWGKKAVAIPIGSVQSVEDGIHLNLTKYEVRDLPQVQLDHPE
jgi:hypothetical protein